MATVTTYNYTPKPFMALLAMFMLIGISYAGVIAALGNTRGVRFFGITFSSTITSMVLWVGVAATIYVSIKSLLAFINGLKGARTITLSDTTITSPKSVLSSKLVTVKIADIHDMSVQNNNGRLILNIKHANGKLVIPSVVFDSIETFHELANKLLVAKHKSG